MITNVLSIAGSDPGGGAGIQADLKTFAALGCHGMAAITALTAQNTRGVSSVHLPPPAFVGEQIRMVFADIAVAAVKIGMLGSREIVGAVADALAPWPDVPIVLDPVLVATNGATLGDNSVVAAMRARLFPRAALVTPNLAEAARLVDGAALGSRAEIEAAARRLRGRGHTAWLIKGGHGAGAEACDLLFDANGTLWLCAPRIATRNNHGTGCTLSSAIAAELAKGASLRDAIAAAKAYLGRALAAADALDVGAGPGPLKPFPRHALTHPRVRGHAAHDTA